MSLRNPRCLGLTLLVLAAALAPTRGALANSMPIDDFETGPFNYFNPADETLEASIPIPGHESHAIAPFRHLRIDDGPSAVTLVTSPGNDDAVVINVETAGWTQLVYDWGFSRDLTFGGEVDRISLVIAGTAGKPVSIKMYSDPSSYGWAEYIQGGGGQQVLTYDLSSVAPQYKTNVDSLAFFFPAAGQYVVYDIRFGAPGSEPLDFQGTFVAALIPPVPSFPLLVDVFGWTTSNPAYRIELAVANAVTDAQTVPAGNWDWQSEPGLGGEIGRAAFLWTEPGGVVETEFEFSFGLSPLSSASVDAYPPDPIHGPESIALAFPIVLRDGGGAATSISHQWVTFDFDERQLGSLEFTDVSVFENPAARSWTDTFTLRFRMRFSGMNSPDDTYTLFHMTWIGGWTPQVTTDAPVVATPEAGGVRLSAIPSVTNGTTELRASRPFARDRELRVLDVAGRAVRTLRLPAGRTAARWDGRNANGGPAAAGVYFVRIAGEPGAVTRVVRMR